jgi:alkylhydroperoxidase family enzyme
LFRECALSSIGCTLGIHEPNGQDYRIARLYGLVAWRETPFYTERERAALAWTEAITVISQGQAPDEVFEQARTQFTEEELVNLTMAIVAINGWNRLAIGFRKVPGTYRQGLKKDRPDG